MITSSNRFKTEMERVLFALHQLVYFTTAFQGYGSTDELSMRFKLKAMCTGLIVHDRILLGKGTQVDSNLNKPLNEFLWERGNDS